MIIDDGQRITFVSIWIASIEEKGDANNRQHQILNIVSCIFNIYALYIWSLVHFKRASIHQFSQRKQNIYIYDGNSTCSTVIHKQHNPHHKRKLDSIE